MITATEPLAPEIASVILPRRQAVAEYAGVPAYYRIDEFNRLVFGWRGTLAGSIGSLNTTHLKSKAQKLFPQLAGVKWEYAWAGYVGITSHQRPMLIELGNNVYAGLGYNGRGITMATMMGKQLSLVLKQQPTGLAVKKLEQIPLHSLHPIGVTARIVCGHVSDYLMK
jgi:glycine/D-amino acid oxidase-like deaminating enzyme